MLISHITPEYIDQQVTFQWRIDQKRWSGKIQFVVLRDGTWYLETVIQMKSDEGSEVWWKKSDEVGWVNQEQFTALKECGIESVVELTWTLVKHFKKEGAYELQVSNLHVLNIAKGLPAGAERPWGGIFVWYETFYTWDLSHNGLSNVSEIRLFMQTYDWMRDHDYTKIDSPIFTSTCAEDSTELYETTHTQWWDDVLGSDGTDVYRSSYCWSS